MTNFDPEAFKGVYSALFTPYDRDGKVNLEMIERMVEFHLKSGLAGFYVTGSTGECFLLSEEERKLVIERVVKSNRGRAKVIAHAGHISTDVAVRLARYAEKCGVDAISAVGPVYYAQTVEGTYLHYREIAQASALPFIVYALANIGQSIVPEDDVKLFKIKNIIGMKYTGTNFFSLQQLSNLIDKPHILFSGSDEHFLGALTFGVSGSIGTSQNFAPKEFVKIYECFNKGDIKTAQKIQHDVNKVINLMLSYGDRSYQKAIMRYIGFDCGNFRKPFKELTEKEYSDFAKKMDKLGVLDRATAEH